MAKSKANSNKTTQTPKDNQEKMADEGIQEHSEHTAENKQPESEENAAKNDDAAKQEEIKQADAVEQPKEQRKLSDYLEIISKSLGILSVLGMFEGGTYIYIYLLQTNQLSIFPDVISNPYVLVVISIYYVILFVLFTLFFFLAYQLGLNIKLKNKSSNRIEIIILIILIFPIILVFISIFIPNYLIAFLTASLIIFIAFMISFFVPVGIIALKDGKIIFKFTLLVSILPISLMISLGNHNLILNFFRFIETNQNSSWYLLHNNFQQNNGSQETSGIDKNDLFKLKQKFKCSALSETERKEKGIKCSPYFEQRNNALFGYMAWNLGDTKVFCPPTVDNTIGDEKEKEKLGKECIVISGKALQIMPESDISTNTDGIDDSNPDNIGHDDPAIDINTDVRFKNDLNAQSNAGLNNFNVQPVLPIQSNAKNMSIQINYGSCNHDSPRNKDGHPDIGYTDKKICQ